MSAPRSTAGGFQTDQRLCGYYLSWFFRCYQANENGWWPIFTPDGKPIGKQDAYFWRSLEVIAQTMMELRAEEMARINSG
jgi:hypothetical protein